MSCVTTCTERLKMVKITSFAVCPQTHIQTYLSNKRTVYAAHTCTLITVYYFENFTVILILLDKNLAKIRPPI